MKRKRKLTPAEEIRRIKHWLVDLDAEWSQISSMDYQLTVFLPLLDRKGERQHVFYGSCFVIELAAWHDVERQVKKALAEIVAHTTPFLIDKPHCRAPMID